MIEREDIVLAVIAAAGGELTGKVRLQKAVYLLDQLGLRSGFEYEYHHYGPFSRDLVNATEDAKAFKMVKEEQGQRSGDLANFSIFKLSPGGKPKSEAFGELGPDRARELMKSLSTRDATVLELAATIHWLWKYEHREMWRAEIVRRKGQKTQHGRLDLAIALLNDLALAPPVAHG